MEPAASRFAFPDRVSLKGALLGLILQRPSHGYELANRLERQLGSSWNINRSTLYRTLKALEDEGLISSDASGETRLERIVYSATPVTERAVEAWMDSLPGLRQARAQLQARMIVARPKDLPKLLVALNHYERMLFVRQAEIEAGLPHQDSLRAAMMYHVREASLQEIRGELFWIDATRRTIQNLIGS
jgi:DNA-binding PadR family transcriptional regulator